MPGNISIPLRERGRQRAREREMERKIEITERDGKRGNEVKKKGCHIRKRLATQLVDPLSVLATQ